LAQVTPDVPELELLLGVALVPELLPHAARPTAALTASTATPAARPVRKRFTEFVLLVERARAAAAAAATES
jgi:hypothetical protein